jgi:hypothetical protein
LERGYRSSRVQADAIEENGNQTEYVICTYCKGKFSDDVQGEKRAQCIMCINWCHEEYAGAHRDKFIGDYCL